MNYALEIHLQILTGIWRANGNVERLKWKNRFRWKAALGEVNRRCQNLILEWLHILANISFLTSLLRYRHGSRSIVNKRSSTMHIFLTKFIPNSFLTIFVRLLFIIKINYRRYENDGFFVVLWKEKAKFTKSRFEPFVYLHTEMRKVQKVQK